MKANHGLGGLCVFQLVNNFPSYLKLVVEQLSFLYEACELCSNYPQSLPTLLPPPAMARDSRVMWEAELTTCILVVYCYDKIAVL